MARFKVVASVWDRRDPEGTAFTVRDTVEAADEAHAREVVIEENASKVSDRIKFVRLEQVQ